MKSPTSSPAHRRQNGQEAVEFALAAPLVIGLLIGLLFAALLLYSQVTISNAARVGTTYLVRHPLAQDAEVEEVIRGQLGVLDQAQVSIEIAPPREERVPNVQVDVTIRYRTPFPGITVPNLAGGAPIVVIGPVNLRADSTLNVE